MDREKWQSALAEYFEEESAVHPLPPREQFTPEQEFQCRILGGTLIPWLQEHGPYLIQEREVLRDSFGVESDPVVVFTSTVPGLVAARQILRQKPPMIFYFTPEAFETFLARHPDEKFRWHVHFSSSVFEELNAELQTRAAAQYPLQPGEKYWLQKECSSLAPLFERGGDHLWKWDGADATLLEEGFNVWLS